MANKQAQKLRDVAQARQLEFSTQIFWQKKLIWKKQLRTERNGSVFFNTPSSFDDHFHSYASGLPGTEVYVAAGLAFTGVPDYIIPLTTPAILSGTEDGPRQLIAVVRA